MAATTSEMALERLDLDDKTEIEADDWAEPPLRANLGLLSPAQKELAHMLVEQNQKHLFAHWPELGVEDSRKVDFFNQVEKLNVSYPGGLKAYISNARKLLADSKAGKNPFEGYTPLVPAGESLTYGDEKFISFEEAGLKEACKAAFVLVAGGLGERLGYNGIKVALPSEITTRTCFLHLYIESILALQNASLKITAGSIDFKIPFVIMTSDDTHESTKELLERNNYFGMDSDQITLLKQEKVACLADNDASLALDPSDAFLIQTKPHGHGDVHALMFSSGLLPKWQQSGVKWVLFFQDTNGLLFKAIPACLGVSSTQNLDVNSLAVRRKAKEPIGGIAKLTHTDGSQMVINVEYNQLDPLLRATGHENGDINDETGFSPYPGNINQLVFKLETYIEELSKTKGSIVEFVNPKYKDATKTSFKSSTRLECMMQDFPRTLPSSAQVGFTVMDAWLAYAPVKNNPEDAAKVFCCERLRVFEVSPLQDCCGKGTSVNINIKPFKNNEKVPEGNPHHSATSGEMAIYKANSFILKKAGAKIEGPTIESFNGQEVEVWPRIVWSPSWGLTYSHVRNKLTGVCEISQRSTLVIEGADITISNLVLDGTLLVRAVDGAEVNLLSVSVQNEGWLLEPIDYQDKQYPEENRIRGFTLQKVGEKLLRYDQAGEYSVIYD